MADPYATVAPDLSATDTAALGERIRRAIAGSPISIGEGRTLPVTTSVGCALGPLGEIEAVLQSADEALYAAKREGRNRVVLT